MKLIQWWLVHRVPVDMIITPSVEAAACMRFKIPESKWEEAKKRFPSLLQKVNQKRLVNRGRRVEKRGVREDQCRVLLIYALATPKAKLSEVGRRGRADVS
jgi:hypothetical protein